MRRHVERPPGAPRACRVEVIDPERMNLLGLLLASILEQRLADPPCAAHAQRLRGEVLVDANGMRVALCFDSRCVRIERRRAERPIARIEGSLTSLLDAALGRRRFEHALRRELHARGRPLALWHVFRLISGRSETK
jgi:hypothetical protein